MTNDDGRALACRVGRVTLRVADLERTSAFYESVVGLAALDRTDDRVTLGAGGTPLLDLLARPDLPQRAPDETGLFHTAFLYPDRGALGDALVRAESARALDGASDHAVSEALYLADPEGNGVELYRDRPRDRWPTADGRVEMVTEPLDLDALREDAAGGTANTTAPDGPGGIDAPGSDEPAAPDGTTVGHVHLEVSSVPDSRSFYVDGLGMALRQEWSGAAFVAGVPAGTDGVPADTNDVAPDPDVPYHHHVGLNAWNDRRAPGDGLGLDRFELVVPQGALDGLAGRLDRHGATVERDDAGLTVDDPDGITLRVRVEE